MNKEIEFVQYAALELKTRGDYYTSADITVGFIVSKCYVVAQNAKFCQDGRVIVSSDVVFPYNDISKYIDSINKFNKYEEIKAVPKLGFDGNCISVAETFDTYELAHSAVMQANDKLRNEKFLDVNFSAKNWKDDYNKFLEEFEESLKVCKEYEQYILENTTNMIIDVDSKKAKVLKQFQNFH